MEQYWMMADTEIGEEPWEDFEEYEDEDEDEVLSPEEFKALLEAEWEQGRLEREADAYHAQWDRGDE